MNDFDNDTVYFDGDTGECCENCSHFDITKDIECEAFAKLHNWDRPILEIDSPLTFRCGVYNAK